MRLTHRLIEVFRTVIQTGNATRTAELLFTSQPSVSRDLSRLEQVTGIRLFERRGGRLYPTAPALALYDEVQRSFVGLDSIAARAETLRTLGEGQLHIAALPCLCDALLPPVCRRFLDDFPDVCLRIEAMESPALESALMNQQVDLGLVEHLDMLPDVSSELLFEGDEQALLPAGHRLGEKPILEPSDFRDQPFVSFSPQDGYRKRIDAVFQELDIPRKLIIETSAASTVYALVEQGIGLSIVNPFSARQAALRGLIVKPFSTPISYRVGCAKPRHRPANQLIDAFLKQLRAEVRSPNRPLPTPTDSPEKP